MEDSPEANQCFTGIPPLPEIDDLSEVFNSREIRYQISNGKTLEWLHRQYDNQNISSSSYFGSVSLETFSKIPVPSLSITNSLDYLCSHARRFSECPECQKLYGVRTIISE